MTEQDPATTEDYEGGDDEHEQVAVDTKNDALEELLNEQKSSIILRTNR